MTRTVATFKTGGAPTLFLGLQFPRDLSARYAKVSPPHLFNKFTGVLIIGEVFFAQLGNLTPTPPFAVSLPVPDFVVGSLR